MNVQAMEALRRAQAMNALERANEARVRNAATFREIGRLSAGRGMKRAAGILLDPDEWQGGMRVGQLLRAAQGVGVCKAQKLLYVAAVRSADRKVRDLSERQRVVLAEELRACGRSQAA